MQDENLFMGGDEKVWIEKNGKELASMEPNLEEHGDPIGGRVVCRSFTGAPVVQINGGGEHGSAVGEIIVTEGSFSIYRAGAGETSRVLIHPGDPFEGQDGGTIMLTNGLGKDVIQLVGAKGELIICNTIGKDVFHFSSETGGLRIGPSTSADLGGEVVVKDKKGTDVFHFNSATGGLRLGPLGGGDSDGSFSIRNKAGRDTIRLRGVGDIRIGGKDSKTNGNIVLFSKDVEDSMDNSKATIRLDGTKGSMKVMGDIVLTNSDCAEEFDVSPEMTNLEPGTVMVIDDNGNLRGSHKAYDKRVAGVISGGGDCKPGIVLGKRDSLNFRVPVALVGKVNCKVDAEHSMVEVGDPLTTSKNPGYAMKATNRSKAYGAVIGKALQSLEKGKSLIPILIALQ